MIRKKVGTITLAVGLITVGAVLLAKNFVEISIQDIYKYWPVLLVGLGIEMILYMFLYSKEKNNVRFKVDGLCILLIIVLAVYSNGISLLNINFQNGFNGGISIINDIRYKSEVKENYSKDNISSGQTVKEVTVSNDFGSIKVLASDSNNIRIEAAVTVKCNDQSKARAYAKDAIDIKEGEVTKISPKNPSNTDQNDYGKAQVDFIIYVPQNVNVSVEDSFGDIEIKDVGGNVTADDKNGKVVISNITGDVTIEDNFGDIEVSDIRGNVSAVSSCGKVKVDGASGKADIRLSFGSAVVENIGGDAVIDNKNGKIEVTEVKGNADIRNAFGDILYKSTNTDNGNIYAKTAFGNISTDKNLKITKDGSQVTATGMLGTGQYRIQLQTSNGSINIK